MIEQYYNQAIILLKQIYQDYKNSKQTTYSYGLKIDYLDGYSRYRFIRAGHIDEFRILTDNQSKHHQIFYYLITYNDVTYKELKGKDYRLVKKIFKIFQAL